MSRHTQVLHFSLYDAVSPYKKAVVHVVPSFVASLYQYMMHLQQQKHRSLGFSQGNAPLAYIEQAYYSHVIKHLKEFLFNYCVADFVLQQLNEHQRVLAEKPMPDHITIDQEHGAYYTFYLYENHPHSRGSWKKNSITQPDRKRYKDIDRQVHEFLTHEVRETSRSSRICIGDWILLRISILDIPQTHDVPHYAWLRIGEEETDTSSRSLFIHGTPFSCFRTSHSFIEQYLSEQLDTEYQLGVEIADRVPGDMFSLELFQHQFQTRTPHETQQTLTQVFSYRNDISQRREIIEKTFKHIFKHFYVSLNEHLIEQQRKHVLEDLYDNPDYHVYKAKSDFEEKVYLLAKKQLKEYMVIDHISHSEGIQATSKDVRAYLNLLLRARTKPFVYFGLPNTQVNGQETPLSYETVRQACLREKTLNYAIRTVCNR